MRPWGFDHLNHSFQSRHIQLPRYFWAKSTVRLKALPTPSPIDMRPLSFNTESILCCQDCNPLHEICLTGPLFTQNAEHTNHLQMRNTLLRMGVITLYGKNKKCTDTVGVTSSSPQSTFREHVPLWRMELVTNPPVENMTTLLPTKRNKPMNMHFPASLPCQATKVRLSYGTSHKANMA